MRQRTLARAVSFSGVCLHTGKASAITVRPAAANTGVNFHVDGHVIAASVAHARTNALTTTLEPTGGRAAVHTVEHLLSALSAFRVDNARVDVRAWAAARGSVPILDGSAGPFADALRGNVCDAADAHGRRAAAEDLVVLRHVSVHDGARTASLSPLPPTSPRGLVLDVRVDFGGSIAGGPRRVALGLYGAGDASGCAYAARVARARTFCLAADLQALRARGLARGGSLDCALVFDADGAPLNAGGLRMGGEHARHKALDAIGDAALAPGARLCGVLRAERPGHALTCALLRALLADARNYALRCAA